MRHNKYHNEIKKLLHQGLSKQDAIFTDKEEEIYLSLIDALHGQCPIHKRF